MHVGEYRRRSCLCGLAACVCAGIARRLDREGLGELERYASDGTVLLSSRGSGRPRTPSAAERRVQQTAELERRRAVLATADFGSNRRYKRSNRRRAVYKRYANGESFEAIAKRFGTYKRNVEVMIKNVERRPRPAQTLEAIARDCDPELVYLFWALLRRALENPDEVRKALDEAERKAAVRDLVREETNGE